MAFTAIRIATRGAHCSACAPRLLTAALLALALAPAAASARMYTPREGDEPIFERDERGAMTWLWGEVMESTLRPADNLGHSFVVQTSYVAAGCVGRGQPFSMGQIAAEASTRGLEIAVPMQTESRILLGEMEVELGGACRGLYPRLPGSPPSSD